MSKSPEKNIRILLIEDNRLLRDGIAAILKAQPDMRVVSSIGHGDNILELILRHKPNVVLLDLGLRSQSSLNLVKLINKNYPDVKIIVMDLIPLQADVYEFVQAGVSGFTLKDINLTDFLSTIRSVYGGTRILPPHLTGSLFSQIVEHAVNGSIQVEVKDSILMTKREKQVILLISEGLTNKEIAQKLHLSTYTVKSHVHNILEKLSLSTRVQIAKHAHFSADYKKVLDNTSLLD
jgi:DNA-binding NarL/FixJ family response regulator